MIPSTPPSSQQYPEPSESADPLVEPESKPPEQLHEADLSEEELRELYDQEEIKRFLRLFSVYVKEVQLPEVPKQNVSKKQNMAAEDSAEDGQWAAVQDDLSRIDSFSSISPTSPLVSTKYNSVSEEIACRYLVPILPGPRPSMPEFTFGRLRLALERMYLFVLPIYLPFFHNLQRLATWEDRYISAIYCTFYWLFWWYNVLFPALIGRILVSLLRRKIFLYPSLEDLRHHRKEIDEADKFGEKMISKMSTSSFVTEMWRLFRLADQTMNFTGKKHAKGKSVDCSDLQSDKLVTDNMETSREERDIKRYGLFILDEIVDVHERIRNIFIWRKPFVSLKYGVALFILFLFSFLPAKYITKLTFFGIGFVFWHVSPVIAALPHSDRRRIPSPLADVPTDAEYAMDLISERVAAGLEVNPGKMGKKDASSKHTLKSPSESNLSNHGATSSIKKSLLGEVKKLHPGKGNPVPGNWPPVHPLLTMALSIAQPQVNTEAHTYPCQHSSGPGLITLTYKALFFTPLMSQNAKFVIPLSAVKGVKKAGMLKGLYLRWTDPTDEEQKEEKFHWVRYRDELFARMIGSEGRRWMKV